MKATSTPGMNVRLSAAEAHKLITDIHGQLARSEPTDLVDIDIRVYAGDPNNCSVSVGLYHTDSRGWTESREWNPNATD